MSSMASSDNFVDTQICAAAYSGARCSGCAHDFYQVNGLSVQSSHKHRRTDWEN